MEFTKIRKLEMLVLDSFYYKNAAGSGDTKWAWNFARDAHHILPDVLQAIKLSESRRPGRIAVILEQENIKLKNENNDLKRKIQQLEGTRSGTL